MDSSKRPTKDVRQNLDDIECKVMEQLTPFQRATVNHIDSLYSSGHMRVLVADEVGLGKTIVARGAIAKIANLRYRENDDLVKVVYICSNGAIAKQNLRKLRIDHDVAKVDPSNSRLSMQHLQLAQEMCDPELKRRYVQLIPLTPATSFQLSSGQGTLAERALMLAVLFYDPEVSSDRVRKGRLKRLMWAKRASEYRQDVWERHIREKTADVRKAAKELEALGVEPSNGAYPYGLLSRVKIELDSEKRCFDDILNYLDEYHKPGRDSWSAENLIISSLRRAFSKASMEMMEPDFVIMDEFQRFRSLINDDDSEMGLLARRFFSGKVRVLLLSATPFRMYSTATEADDEAFGESSQEFREVMDFLAETDSEAKLKFKQIWTDYSHSLMSVEINDDAVALDACLAVKGEAEERMGTYIARTERASTGELAEITRIDVNPRPVAVGVSDIAPYFILKSMTGRVGIPSGSIQPDYVKSCPFPMSYMRDYQLKKELVSKGSRQWDKLAPVLTATRKKYLWLDRDRVQNYLPLNVKHARYQALRDDVFDSASAEQLLWIPASLPYYSPDASSPFAKAGHFSKMLVFSSWAMVPPALSTLLSYEAEQRNVVKLQDKNDDSEYRYFKLDEDKDDVDEGVNASVLPHGRLSLTMPKANSFCLVYPSPYLASLFDGSKHASSRLTLTQLRKEVSARIRADLSAALSVPLLPAGRPVGDIDWYAMATLLLDKRSGHDLLGDIVASAHMGEQDYKAAPKTLAAYLNTFESFEFTRKLHDMPNDLVEVLADAAIASPAVCAFRSYYPNMANPIDLFYPFEFGYAFMTKMNTAAATTTIAACMEKGKTASAAHWKHVLAYCAEGNFQAMLDEYVHLIRSAGARTVKQIHNEVVGPKIGNDKTPSLHKTDSRITVEMPEDFKSACGARKNAVTPTIMRTNFAAGFMETKGPRGKGENKRGELRAAFNSPFRPFVLVSTSVGQEGLDFHQYCRRIVHWNLPSSPIDFEQREGRINRYKSLAVRQTLAERYGADVLGAKDLWNALFDVAETKENERANAMQGGSGLLPYWGVTPGEPRVPIERLVYNYPFSRDEDLYRYLLETAARYRAVLGQPNQEELLGLLERKFGSTGLMGKNFEKLFMNLCPYCRLGNVTD